MRLATATADVAHSLATTRDTFNRQRINAALSDYAAALRAALPLLFADREAYCHRYIAATYTAEVRLLEAGAA